MTSPSPAREPLVPTINFSMVCPGVYRGGYPTKKNFSFLRALRLRSILYLCPEEYAESNLKFCEENGIHVLRFPTEGNKEPFSDIMEPLMHRILSAVCDTRNLPLLIHCNKGKHRTGTVVACLRHLQGWSLVSTFEEYKRFASDKARVGDQQYVELYHPIVRVTPPFIAPWVTVTPRVTLVTSERELMEAEALQLGYSLLAPDKISKKGAGGIKPLGNPSTPPASASSAAPTAGLPTPLTTTSATANNTNVSAASPAASSPSSVGVKVQPPQPITPAQQSSISVFDSSRSPVSAARTSVTTAGSGEGPALPTSGTAAAAAPSSTTGLR